MKSRLIFVLLIIIILSSIAFAEEFTVYSSQSQVDVCACSLYENTILLRNDGVGVHSYSISQDGLAKQWSSLFPEGAFLEPGSTQELTDFIKVPCGTKGRYDLKTTVEENSGLKKLLTQSINVKSCSNIDATFQETEIETCPCTIKTIKLTIKNPGSFADTYSIQMDELPISAKITESGFTLKPGESKDLFIYISSDCSTFGDFKLNLYVSSAKNGETKKLSVDVSIKPCYDFNLVTGKNSYKNTTADDLIPKDDKYLICEGQKTSIPILLQNLAKIKNNYYLSLKAPDWASLRFNAISNLSTNETFVGYIDLNPGQFKESKEVLKLKVLTDLGGQSQEYEIPVDVLWCNTAQIEIKDKYRVHYQESYFPLKITNSGLNSVNYSVKLNSPGWVRVMQKIEKENETEYVTDLSSLSLNSKETANLLLAVSPNESVAAGEYDIRLEASAYGQEDPYSKSARVILSKKNFLSYFYDFVIAYSWQILIGLLILLILIFLLKRFLERREIKETTQKTLRVEKPKKLEPLAREGRRKKIWKNIIIFIIILLLIAIAAFYLWKAYPFGAKTTTNASAETIQTNGSAIANVTVNATVNDTATENETNESSVQEFSFENINCSLKMYEGEEFKFNLSKAFNDPDGDQLHYDYNLVPSHVNITIDGDTAAASPEKGYIGTDYVEFTADDMKGGSVSSGILTLCIEKGKPQSTSIIKQTLEDVYSYLYYILAGIIILIIIIVIMIINERSTAEEVVVVAKKPPKKRAAKKKKSKKKKKKKAKK